MKYPVLVIQNMVFEGSTYYFSRKTELLFPYYPELEIRFAGTDRKFRVFRVVQNAESGDAEVECKNWYPESQEEIGLMVKDLIAAKFSSQP